VLTGEELGQEPKGASDYLLELILLLAVLAEGFHLPCQLPFLA